jgi:hypothetical protein
VGWVATKNLRIATHPFFLAMFFIQAALIIKEKKFNHVADPGAELDSENGVVFIKKLVY